MINYNINKGNEDGFSYLIPSEIYRSAFGEEPACIYDTEYAFYKLDIYKKIEERYPCAQKYEYKIFLNNNKDLVESEVVYSHFDSGTVLSVNVSWGVYDYPIMDTDMDDLDTEDTDIKVGKNDKFQAKFTLYTHKNDPEVCGWLKSILSNDKKPKRKDREINIICHSGSDGFYLKGFKTNKVDIVLEDNYNEDFLEVAEVIQKRLKKKNDNGIVLLHSIPGCGKTSFIRLLTKVITNKRLIYMPPNLTEKLADPDFMTFMMNYPNSVIFIEDAENSLQARGNGFNNPAVSNLLNSSDGLLGDILRLQLVCTFNCPVANIDPALMRPGRLIAEYKFDRLTEDKTLNLIKKLYGEDSEVHEEFKRTRQRLTLAEAYNIDKKKYMTDNKNQGIGFKNK